MKKRHGVLGFLVSLSRLTFLDRLSIAVAGPRIQDDLHIRPAQWGRVLGAFALSYGIFEIPSGALGERRGQRRVLTRIVVWWSTFTTGAATTFPQLVVTQFLFGAAEAGAYPNASGVIARWFPKSERARAQGAFASFGLLWATLWRRWFPDRPVEQPGITAAVREIGDSSPVSHGRAVWVALLRSPEAWLLIAMYWCYVLGSWFYFSWFPTYLMRGRGFSDREMGFFSSLPFLCGCAGNLTGWLSDRLASRFGWKIARCGLASSSLAVSSLSIFGLALATGKTAVVILASCGLGVLDLMLPAAWSLCIDVGKAHAGVLTGAMNGIAMTGGFVCTLEFGYLVRSSGGYRVPLCLIAAMVMTSGILFLFIDPNRPVWQEET